jgi:hypothetical protein
MQGEKPGRAGGACRWVGAKVHAGACLQLPLTGSVRRRRSLALPQAPGMNVRHVAGVQLRARAFHARGGRGRESLLVGEEHAVC